MKKQYDFNLLTCYPNGDADCFNYYDGPLVFFEQDSSGQLWFLYCADLNKFMCFPVDSRDKLRPMLDNLVSIRDTLTSLPEAFLIEVVGIGSITAQPIDDWSDPLFDQYLPDQGVFMFRKGSNA